jgi:methionyl aminopeptidase
MAVKLKDDRSIKKIAVAGNIIYEILRSVTNMNLKGMTTEQLNDRIDAMIRERGGSPTFLQYRGFPKSCCISLNHEVVHGIPDDRIMKNGDLVKIDVGVTYDGFIADAATTIPIGKITDDAQHLIDTTKRALASGIAQARQGNHIADISRTIQETVEKEGFGVVRELTGHGVGNELHEEPMIPNFVCNAPSPRVDTGMVIAIEPMVTMGEFYVITQANGWTVATRDGSLAAHFEDTVAVLKRGTMNLTRVVEG